MPHRIPIGAHLISTRSHYAHHGIYVGRGKVVHYAGKSRGVATGPVELTTLADFAQGRGYKVKTHATSLHRGMEVVKRARSRLGENLYDLTSNNCEHFCEWCINGKSRSLQVRSAKEAGVQVAAATSPGWLPALAPKVFAMAGIVVAPPVALLATGIITYIEFQKRRVKDEA